MSYKDPEKRREANRKWAAENPEKQQASRDRWKIANRERSRENERKRRASDPEKGRAYARKWQSEHPENGREKNLRRRAQKKGTSIATVDLEFIWQRDKGICYLCNEPIAPDDCHFDHVIPLSKGGSHTADNLRATHSKCNISKKDKLIDVGQVVKWIQHKLF